MFLIGFIITITHDTYNLSINVLQSTKNVLK